MHTHTHHIQRIFLVWAFCGAQVDLLTYCDSRADLDFSRLTKALAMTTLMDVRSGIFQLSQKNIFIGKINTLEEIQPYRSPTSAQLECRGKNQTYFCWLMSTCTIQFSGNKPKENQNEVLKIAEDYKTQLESKTDQ